MLDENNYKTIFVTDGYSFCFQVFNINKKEKCGPVLRSPKSEQLFCNELKLMIRVKSRQNFFIASFKFMILITTSKTSDTTQIYVKQDPFR